MSLQHNTSSEDNAKRLLSPSMLNAKNSECLEYCDVQSDVSLAVWGNHEDQVVTENKGIHTLSLYLEGGLNAYRKDKKHLQGGPGKVCFIPADHVSEWCLDDPIRLLHLYFTDSHLNYLGLTAFDVDPRVLQLQDLTYSEDPWLIKSLGDLKVNMNPQERASKVLLQESQQQILLYLLENYSQRKRCSVNGGLSPHSKHRVFDFIVEHLGQDVSLNDLADVACLSTFHFARMFKNTTGLSPYQYLLKQRLEMAARKLQQQQNVLDVALSCGYSNHSRFARAFRGMYGLSPKEYRSLFLN